MSTNNPNNPPPVLAITRTPVVDKQGNLRWEFLKQLQDWGTAISQGLGSLGQVVGELTGKIAASAKIEGRTEGIGTTVGNLDADGVVKAEGVDLSRPYVNKNFQHIDGVLASTQQVNNGQLNSTNFCTVDSIDNGSSATIRVYGSGGIGTTWTRKVGSVTLGPYPALLQGGLAYSTAYYVMFDPDNSSFFVTTDFASSLDDHLIFCGLLTTVNSGGGGGTTGGGGNTGSVDGCVEVGTPVIEPEGTIQEIVDNTYWVGLQFPGHSPVNMHPDTRVCVWKKAVDLQPGDCISVGRDGMWRTDWTKRHFCRASKKVKRTCPGGRYFAGTAQIELHNMKQF